ncbi:MAG: hypothetical protein IPM80_13375 [Proteobacteria bacterium]|nr:hypothetical protein [Pseudomonadota bacterium]
MRADNPESIDYRREADSFEVRAAVNRVMDAVRKHRLLILLCCMFCLVLVWLYVKTFPPVFRAEVLVRAEADDDKAREMFYSQWNTFRKIELSSERELMTSSPVVRQVVTKLNLGYDDVYHSHLKQITYLWSKSAVGNAYRSVKRWIFPPTPAPFEPSPEEVQRSKTVKGFQDGAALEPVPDSHVGYLVVKGPSFRVAEMANALIDEYMNYRRQMYVDEAENAYRTLGEEVERAARERDRVMQARLEFENQNQLAMGFVKDKAIMTNWAELKSRIDDTEFKLKNLEASLKVVDAQLSQESPTVLKSDMMGRNPVRDEMEQTLFGLNKDLAAAGQIYQPGSPELRAVASQIADLERRLAREPRMLQSATDHELSERYESLRARRQQIVAELASTRAELERMRQTHADTIARLASLPALEKQYLVLERDQEIALIRLRELSEKLMQADVSRIAAKSAPSSLKVVDYASAPDKSSWPNVKLLSLVALLFGLAGGTGLALLAELLNNRATRSNLVQRPDLPVYATIEITHRTGRLRCLTGGPPARLHNPVRALERLRNEDS